MVSRADIAEQFSNFGISFNDEVLEKCWDICTDHSLGADELLETWIAYCVSHYDGAEPTVEYLTQMERDELHGRKQTPSKPSASERKKEGLKIFESGSTPRSPTIIENDILQAYYTTPKALKSESKLQSSPVEINVPPKKPLKTSLNFSPASFSPKALESPESYTKRENSGKVVCSFNVPEKSEWTWSEQNESFCPEVEMKGKELTSKRVYGGAHLHTLEQILDDYIERMGNHIDHYLDSYEPWPLDVGSQAVRRYLGRICVEGDGRINMHSVMLEGHSNATKDGKPVLMDTSMMTNPGEGHGPPVPFAFFPGQVVVAEGKNERGRLICCSNVHSKATAPLPPVPRISMETGPLRIVVGAGPFTQTDSLSYQPLKDLVEYVTLHKPHVLILIGPFVDALHPQVSGEQVSPIAESFSKYFERTVDGILESLRGINVHVVLVASPRDVNTCGVYPTVAFSSWSHKEGSGPKRPKLTMAPDPCILDIEGVVIGVTSTDILMHISRDETASNNHTLDRLSRLSRHIIEQQNFYPLYPSDVSVCLDVPLWFEMCNMPLTPHILILPSDFRCFTKVVEGCVVINPERLTKGFSAGSFAKVEVNPAKDWNSSIADQVKVQVVKI